MSSSKQQTPPCADSAHTAHHVINEITAARIMMLASDPAHLHEIGESFAMLVLIIHTCAEKDGCDMNLHDAAKRLAISHNTAKNWLKALVQRGLVTKQNSGVKGVRITLNMDLFGEAVSYLGNPNDREMVISQLESLKSVMLATLDGTIRGVMDSDVAA